MTVGFNTIFPKNSSTRFVVLNIAPNRKRIKIFGYPINNGQTRDLLTIPFVSEADIRHSLLKGELLKKIQCNEIRIVDSDIDLLQFNDEQKTFLQNVGLNKGLQVDSGSLDLRQLILLAEGVGGPMEGFTSGAYRETLPLADPFPTSIIWWTSLAQTTKLVEKTIVRDSQQNPVTINWKVYDTDGITILTSITDTITYDDAFEISRTRAIL